MTISTQKQALLINRQIFLNSLSGLKAYYTMLVSTYEQAQIELEDEELFAELKFQIESIGEIIHGFDSCLDPKTKLKNTKSTKVMN